jgi:UDPglucose 6-dehydrogenase
MKIAVVGAGYVGLVLTGCFAEEGNHVTCTDKDKRKIEKLKRGILPIYEPGLADIVRGNIIAGRLVLNTDLKLAVEDSQVIFIAVGTPSADDGSADISAVLHVTGKIATLMNDYRIIAIKSTVPVGTHKRVCEFMASKTDKPFSYVSNPEFLREGSAVEDFMKPDRVIIGTRNSVAAEIMKQLYAPLMHNSRQIIITDPASAEMIKYAANAMLATRISFINEIAALCEKLGTDIELVRKGVGSDSRIGYNFLCPSVGYGGSCLPKDIRALIHMGDVNNSPMTIIKAVQQANLKQQDHFAEKVLQYFKDKTREITLGVWGLAFKPKTNDIRESPAIRCIRKFINAGVKIKAYDPEAMPAVQAHLGRRIETVLNSYDVLNGADALVIFTDWQEFRTPDFDMIASKLKNSIIFDGRNLYEPSYVTKYGIAYYSIGRTVCQD